MILMTREERFELGTAYKRKPTILLSYMTLDNLLKKKKILRRTLCKFNFI